MGGWSGAGGDWVGEKASCCCQSRSGSAARSVDSVAQSLGHVQVLFGKLARAQTTLADVRLDTNPFAVLLALFVAAVANALVAGREPVVEVFTGGRVAAALLLCWWTVSQWSIGGGQWPHLLDSLHRQTRRLTRAVPSRFGLSSTVTVLQTRSLKPFALQKVVHWNEFSHARYSWIACANSKRDNQTVSAFR